MESKTVPAPPDDASIRAALKKILQSKRFRRTKNAITFLRYIVEQKLANADEGYLTEYGVGTYAFKRKDFDGKEDNVVRREAGRLRTRLSKYYKEEGKLDDVRISLPDEGYAPIFSSATIEQQAPPPPPQKPVAPPDPFTATIQQSLSRTLEQIQQSLANPTVEGLKGRRATEHLRPLKVAFSTGDFARIDELVNGMQLETLSPPDLRDVLTILQLVDRQAKEKATPPQRAIRTYQVARQLFEKTPDELESQRAVCAAAQAALQAFWAKQRWADVVEVVDTVLPLLREMISTLTEREIGAFRYLRFCALNGLRHFALIISEVQSYNIREAFPAETYADVLCFLAGAHGGVDDGATMSGYLNQVWAAAETVGAEKSRISMLLLGIAGKLYDLDLPKHALTIADFVQQGMQNTCDIQGRVAHALSRELGVRCAWSLNDEQQSLMRYADFEKQFVGDSNAEILTALLWGAVVGTRALRAMQQYQLADDVARALPNRFGQLVTDRAKLALAWAACERSQNPFAAKEYARAAEVCSEFLTSSESIPPGSDLDWPIAWAYAQRVRALRKLNDIEGIIHTCDDLVVRFGNSENANVQFEVAWTMLEKAVALRYSKRLAASAAVARDVATRFASSTDPRVIAEVTWTMHVEGDARLCEAKLMIHSGLIEDAEIKLLDAERLFREAYQRDSNQQTHLQCICYSRFLRGDKLGAKEAFETARLLGRVNWLDEDRDWFELSFFPLPADVEFACAVRQWLGNDEGSSAASANA